MTVMNERTGEQIGSLSAASAWEHLTRVQCDAVRATAAATGSDPEELARELQPLLHIPRSAESDSR